MKLSEIKGLSLARIDAEIKALQVLRMQSIVDANAESKAALAAIERGFEWRVVSSGLGQYHVSCRFDAATLAAFAAWRERYPVSLESIRVTGSDDLDKWHGMSYVIARSSDGVPFMLSSGGGSMVLAREVDSFRGSYELTEEQFATFMRGDVPVELRKPW